MIKSPFKFLDSYTLDDRDIFFGRDQEIAELYRRVFENKILLIYGISGTGKSSLINCGLASRFDESDWLPINVRRGGNIIESLDESLSNHAISSFKTSYSPLEKLQSIYLDQFKPIYLIFDQFEELYIFGNREERKAFIQIIKSINDSDLKCRILFIMREEYMAGVTEFESYIPTFFDNRIRIEKMSHVNALEAIKKPCKVFDINIEEGFAEMLLEKLSPGSTEVELTYLQVFLDKVFRLALGENVSGNTTGQLTFPVTLLEKVGNVSDLLGSFLDEQISRLNDPDTAMVLLKSFVSVKGTKRQMTSDEAREYAMALGKSIDDSLLMEMLQIFINLRILREKDQNDRFELRHDDLATKIYEKITLVEKEILGIRQFIENAWQNCQNRGVFLSAEDLAYIAPYEDKLFINRKLEQFISDSKKLHAKARRQRRTILTAAVALLFAILAFFTVWAMNERKKAVEQSSLAENQRTEAVKARDDAINARNESNRLRREAVQAKDEALVQKSVADSALIVAEKEKRVSETQRTRAENLYYEANTQKQLAQESEERAEKSALEVLETNRKALYQLYLFNAKEFANKSLLLEKNDTLKALLALTAYDLVNQGYRNYSSKSDSLNYEIVILEAMQQAYSKFESGSLSKSEIWDIESYYDKIIFSDTLGRILLTKLEEQGPARLPLLRRLESINLPKNSFIRALAVNISDGEISCGTSEGYVFLTARNNEGTQVTDLIYNHKGGILSMAFIPEKNWIVSSSVDKTLKIWDVGNRSLIQEIQMTDPVKNITPSDKNQFFFSDEKGRIYSMKTSNIEDKPEIIYENKAPVNAMIFNKTLQWLVFATYGDIMAFMSVTTLSSPVVFPQGHTGMIISLSFSPDCKWLSSAALDGTVMLWDIEGQRESELDKIVPVEIKKENSKALSLLFDHESKYLLYGNNYDLQIFPVNMEIIHGKLKSKMGTRTINRNEWEYYIRGDLKFESQSSK